jgi:molecular chaperone DnaK (HSP70)
MPCVHPANSHLLPCRCLTVPAMWSEASKQIMRSAALRAGLITSFSSPRLILILEPEAAALHALVHRAPPLTAGRRT